MYNAEKNQVMIAEDNWLSFVSRTYIYQVDLNTSICCIIIFVGIREAARFDLI